MTRLRWRPLAIAALLLLALVSVETAVAVAHAHASLDGCAPCRLLVVSGSVELPSSAALPAPIAADLEAVPADTGEIARPAAPTRGRAPPVL